MISPIDIVIATHKRLDYLTRTIAGIQSRTFYPYRLHIINDGSDCSTFEYLNLWVYHGVESVTHRVHPLGIAANLCAIGPMTTSDIVVYTDDDVLCPKVDPDWLSRGIEAMLSHTDIGLLGLNAPSCNMNGGDRRKKIRVDGEITRCAYLGGQFLFMRRALLDQMPTPDTLAGQSPVKNLCRWAAAEYNWGIAYLTDTYCWHFGTTSARTRNDISSSCQVPVNMDTLEPVDELKG